jgi:hypothetical protein
MDGGDVAFGSILAIGVSILFASTCATGKDWGRNEARREAWDHERTVQENDKCALRGLVLLRGQLGEYVCVVPGSERGRRRP